MPDLALAVFFIQYIARVAGGDIALLSRWSTKSAFIASTVCLIQIETAFAAVDRALGRVDTCTGSFTREDGHSLRTSFSTNFSTYLHTLAGLGIDLVSGVTFGDITCNDRLALASFRVASVAWLACESDADNLVFDALTFRS